MTLSQTNPKVVALYEKILTKIGLLPSSPNEEKVTMKVTTPDLNGEHFGSACEYIILTDETRGTVTELFSKRILENSTESKTKENSRVDQVVTGNVVDPKMDQNKMDDVEPVQPTFFQKEANCFNKLFPNLCLFVGNKKPDLKLNFLPHCYYADDETIIMENLVKQGFNTLDKFRGQDADHAKIVLTTFARLHGSSYLMIEEHGGLKNFLQAYPFMKGNNMSGKSLDTFFVPWFEPCWTHCLRYCDELEASKDSMRPVADIEKARKLIESLRGNVIQRMAKAVSVTENRHLAHVVNHGDCWTPNMLFLKDVATQSGHIVHDNDNGSNHERNHVLVDFQITNIASPSFDLAYYFFTSVNHEVRRNSWEPLIKFYFDELDRVVKSLGGNLHFSYEDLVVDYKKNCFVGFTFGLAQLATMKAIKEEGCGDLEELDGDMLGHLHKLVSRWMTKNPEQALITAGHIVDMCNEVPYP